MKRGESNYKREKQVSVAGLDIPKTIADLGIVPDYFNFLHQMLMSEYMPDKKWAARELGRTISRMVPQTNKLEGSAEGGAIVVQWKSDE